VFVIAEIFSLRGIGCCEIAVHVPHGVTSSDTTFNLFQGIARPCGENAAAKFHPLKKKKALREVSAYSTVCTE
jgi:hypothetical protein